jgi:hypothetical protein
MNTKIISMGALLFLVNGSRLPAQEYHTTVQDPKATTLILENFGDELPIEGYAGNDILVTVVSNSLKETPERAKGLKAVYPAGTDNTGIAIEAIKDGNTVKLVCLNAFFKHDMKYKLKVPENIALRIHTGCEYHTMVEIEDIKNEIDVEVCKSIKLKNVSGPLVLSSINGEISVVFTELSSKPISIADINGEVDVTLPSKSAINLEMENFHGGMYTDFDVVKDKKDDMKQVGGNKLMSKINGGGTDLKITNINGNIYLRKG